MGWTRRGEGKTAERLKVKGEEKEKGLDSRKD